MVKYLCVVCLVALYVLITWIFFETITEFPLPKDFIKAIENNGFILFLLYGAILDVGLGAILVLSVKSIYFFQDQSHKTKVFLCCMVLGVLGLGMISLLIVAGSSDAFPLIWSVAVALLFVESLKICCLACAGSMFEKKIQLN